MWRFTSQGLQVWKGGWSLPPVQTGILLKFWYSHGSHWVKALIRPSTVRRRCLILLSLTRGSSRRRSTTVKTPQRLVGVKRMACCSHQVSLSASELPLLVYVSYILFSMSAMNKSTSLLFHMVCLLHVTMDTENWMFGSSCVTVFPWVWCDL